MLIDEGSLVVELWTSGATLAAPFVSIYFPDLFDKVAKFTGYSIQFAALIDDKYCMNGFLFFNSEKNSVFGGQRTKNWRITQN
jgi:hypothetical protein